MKRGSRKFNKVAYRIEIGDSKGALMTVADFNKGCDSGQYECGFGYPVKGGRYANLMIRPRGRDKIPFDATHILWFNKDE